MSLKSQFQVAVVNEISNNTTVNIAASSESSTILNCGGTSPTGIILPANFTSCNLTFMVSKTPNGTFVPLTNFDGSAFALAAAASEWIPLLPAMFNSVLYLQLSCSVSQTDAVVVDFALAPIYQGIHN